MPGKIAEEDLPLTHEQIMAQHSQQEMQNKPSNLRRTGGARILGTGGASSHE